MFGVHVALFMITLSLRCTWEWNETEFCHDVFSCTRNNTNQPLMVDEGTDHYENDTDICELARRCTTTVNTTSKWESDTANRVLEVEEDYHQRKRNKSDFCFTVNSCKYIANANDPDYESQYLRNVSHYCPYADYCGVGASEDIHTDDKTSLSCCASCNCKPDCGKNRECCFFRHDKYRTVQTENLTCISNIVMAGNIKASFYMVDKCPNGTKCYNEEKGFVRNPVSTSLTKRIYINKQCAECHFPDNPKQAYIPWPVNVPEIEPHQALSCATHTCRTVYGIPPSHWSWIRNFACGNNYRNACPKSTQDQGLVDACKNIHAPVFLYSHGRGVLFANSYCIMCHKYMSRYDPTQLCRSTVGSDRGPDLGILLDFDIIYKHKQVEVCDKNNALVALQQNQVDSRAVLCPEWTVKVNGKCLHFTKEWRNVFVTLQITLKPHNNEQIQASSFQNMTKHERFHFYTWLSNECQLDLNITDPRSTTKIKIYMLSAMIEKVPVVKEFLLRMEFKWNYLKPSSLLASIKRCIESRWKVARDGNVHYLSAKFYRYKSFMPDGKTKREYISRNKTYSETPLPKVYEPITVMRDFYYNGSPEKYVLRLFKNGIKVTKMAFCERVQLCHDEVDLLYGQIRIKINNRTLGDAEFSTQYIYANNRHTLTQIYVCKKDIVDMDVKNAGVPQSTLSFVKTVTLLVGIHCRLLSAVQ